MAGLFCKAMECQVNWKRCKVPGLICSWGAPAHYSQQEFPGLCMLDNWNSQFALDRNGITYGIWLSWCWQGDVCSAASWILRKMQQLLLMNPSAIPVRQLCSHWKNFSISEGILYAIYFLVEGWWVQQRHFSLHSVLLGPCRWDCAPVWSLQLEVTFLSSHKQVQEGICFPIKIFVPPYAAGSLMSLTGVERGENPTWSCLFKYCL